MKTDRYEGVVKAAMKGENALWEMGDEIIKITGAAYAPPGQNDGSRKEIERIREELIINGIDQYKVKTLADIRLTSIKFKAADRIHEISYRVHREAGSPETLIEARDYAKQLGRKLSCELMSEYKKARKQEEKEARQEARRDALEAKKQAEAEVARAKEDKRAANSPEAKEAAAKREQEARERVTEAARLAQDLKSPPSVSHSRTKRDPDDIPILVVRTSFSANLQKAKALAEKMRKDIEPHLNGLSDAFVASAVDELLEVAEAYRKLSLTVRSAKTNKRAHLYAVGE